MKKIVFLFILLACIIGSVGCEYSKSKLETQVKYDYKIKPEITYFMAESIITETYDSFIDFRNNIFNDRYLFIKYGQDYTFVNTLTAASQIADSIQPAYTSTTTGTSMKTGNIYYYDATTTVYKKPQREYRYFQSYVQGGIGLILDDNFARLGLLAPILYKERPKGWREDIDKAMSRLYESERKSIDEYTGFYLITQVIQVSSAESPYIFQNVILEDMNGNRYKANELQILSPYSIYLKYPYKISEKDKYIKIYLFDFLKEKEICFTWYFEEPPKNY